MKGPQLIQAEELFFSSQGRLSYSEIAALVHVTKRTVTRWAVKYNWQGRVTALTEEIQRKVTDKLSDDLAARAVDLIRDSWPLCKRPPRLSRNNSPRLPT